MQTKILEILNLANIIPKQRLYSVVIQVYLSIGLPEYINTFMNYGGANQVS